MILGFPRGSKLLAVCGRIIPLLALGALTSCAYGVLSPQGQIAAADHLLMMNALTVMLAIVIPTIATALAFAWWFRASNTRAKRRPDFVYSGRIELIVWGIPLLTILFLGGLIWIGAHELDPAQPIASHEKPLEVQVVSLDWKFLFIYPGQGVATLNTLTIPANKPVHFSLTSASVLNTFFVPQLGSMIYLMNGMVTQLYLQADHPGDYFGESGMFSGDGFSDMNFTVHAVGPADFASWVARAQQSHTQLDHTAYQNLLRQTQHDASTTYRTTDTSLFQDIATQKLLPGLGPPVARGGAETHAGAEN